MSGDLSTAPGIISLSPLPTTDRRDWLNTQGKWSLASTQTEAGGNVTLIESFFGRSPWLHGQLFTGPFEALFTYIMFFKVDLFARSQPRWILVYWGGFMFTELLETCPENSTRYWSDRRSNSDLLHENNHTLQWCSLVPLLAVCWVKQNLDFFKKAPLLYSIWGRSWWCNGFHM